MKDTKIKLISLFLLYLIINFGINEVSGKISSGHVQTNFREKSQDKKLASNMKMGEVSQRNSRPVQNQSLKPDSQRSWGYVDSPETYGPSDWSKYYPHCGGSSQSPISIMRNITEKSKKWPTNLTLIIPTGGDILQGVLENNGHMFSIKIDGDQTNIKITGGPLQETKYYLDQIHFHISCSRQTTGSEHVKLPRKHTAEVQFYSYNDKYSSFESALNKSDGLVVLGFLVGFGYHGNKGIINLNKFINNITEPHTLVNIGSSISIYDIISQAWEKDLPYDYYQGSLTTPPCYESVTWIIAKDALKVRVADIKPWTTLKGDKVNLICNNNRPLQNLNQRKVYSVED